MRPRSNVLTHAWFRSFLAGLLVLAITAMSAPGNAMAEAASAPADAPRAAAAGKWIDIDLSSQSLSAYVGKTRVFSTRVSTGTYKYPTVKGTFRIYSKLRSQRMRGGTGRDRYDLPNVPHVMYFYAGYAIHGAYWHNNFGRQMSHGCVNLPLGAAQWMYNWAPVGTQVVVHQ